MTHQAPSELLMIPPEINEDMLQDQIRKLATMLRASGYIGLIATTKPEVTKYTESIQKAPHDADHVVVIVVKTDSTSRLFARVAGSNNVMVVTPRLWLFEFVYDNDSMTAVFWRIARFMYVSRNIACPVCNKGLSTDSNTVLAKHATQRREAAKNAHAMASHARKIGKPFSKDDIKLAFYNSLDSNVFHNFACPGCGQELHSECVPLLYTCDRCGLQARTSASGAQVYSTVFEAFPVWMCDETKSMKEKRDLMREHITKRDEYQ